MDIISQRFLCYFDISTPGISKPNKHALSAKSTYHRFAFRSVWTSSIENDKSTYSPIPPIKNLTEFMVIIILKEAQNGLIEFPRCFQCVPSWEQGERGKGMTNLNNISVQSQRNLAGGPTCIATYAIDGKVTVQRRLVEFSKICL